MKTLLFATFSLFLLTGPAHAATAAGTAAITRESLAPVVTRGGIEILLIGCGRRMVPLPKVLREELRAAGIVADAMDTGAACRTYNILLAEDRRVAAALLPAG